LKKLLLMLLLVGASNAKAEWLEYSIRVNGDVYFYDPVTIKKRGALFNVWNRIQYKSSVMGARSYQSLMQIDCSNFTKKILQNTFYTDRNWTNPAIATDTQEKPKIYIKTDSATHQLVRILCN